MHLSDHSYDIEFEVIDQDVPNILGHIEMNLVQHIDTVTDDTQKIFEKYNDAFKA